jgi:hypothetical protein
VDYTSTYLTYLLDKDELKSLTVMLEKREDPLTVVDYTLSTLRQVIKVTDSSD